MKTSRMLLRLLVLVGCLILLLDTRYRSFATWAAECGVYDTAKQLNCPDRLVTTRTTPTRKRRTGPTTYRATIIRGAPTHSMTVRRAQNFPETARRKRT